MLSFLMLIASKKDVAFVLLLISFVFLVYLTVVSCILWSKSWSFIQDGHARTTPGRAIGFMFIPFFSFYWLFQLIYGFAKDFNAYVDRYNAPTKKLSEPLFLTICIMLLVGVFMNLVPGIGIFYSFAVYIVMIFLVVQLIDAVNQLPDQAEQFSSDVLLPQEKAPGCSDNKFAGVIAILLSAIALLHEMVFFTDIFLSPFGRMILGVLALLNGGVVIFLATRCRHAVLKVLGICVPVLVILVHLLRWMTRPFPF